MKTLKYLLLLTLIAFLTLSFNSWAKSWRCCCADQGAKKSQSFCPNESAFKVTEPNKGFAQGKCQTLCNDKYRNQYGAQSAFLKSS